MENKVFKVGDHVSVTDKCPYDYVSRVDTGVVVGVSETLHAVYTVKFSESCYLHFFANEIKMSND